MSTTQNIVSPKEAHLTTSTASKASSDIERQHEETQEKSPERPPLTRADSEFEYPPTAQGAVIMIAIMLAIFLVSLDRTIIATAIPAITNEFNSLDDIGWYGSSFLLASCSTQLLFGRFYSYWSPKKIFLGVIVLFEAGSALCGAAPTSNAFIAGRVITGMGAAAIFSGGIILMTSSIPLAKRPLYQGLFGAVFGISSVLGPLVGGSFTSNVTWRWCFYINLPIGGVVFVILLFILKPTEPAKRGTPILQQLWQLDPLGNLCFIPSMVCLLLALQLSTTWGWSDARIIALFCLFGVLFILFIMEQIYMNRRATAAKPSTALVQYEAIRTRSIQFGMLLTFCLASGMMLFIYYLSIWFQAIKGDSAVQSGIDLLPMVLSLVIASILSGILTSRIGYYNFAAIFTAIVMPIGAGCLTLFDVNTSTAMYVCLQCLYGIGIGASLQVANLAAQTTLKRALVPSGVSLIMLCQQLGPAIFLTVGQNVFQNNLVTRVSAQVPSLNAGQIMNTGATDLRGLVPADALPGLLVAYNDSLRQVFYVATGMACVAAIGCLGLEWKSVKKAKDGKSAAKPDKVKSQETAEEKV